MASHEDFLNENPAAASDSAPSPSGESGDDERPADRTVTVFVEHGQDLFQALKSHPGVVAAVAAVAAAAAIGIKVAYDRRKSTKVRNRVLHQLEEARETLAAVAAELPERGRAVLHRVANR
ncbi:hypothetical protein [Glycomyces sp. YM15]|uniref:hypothetical protein n=1 Tax=Glycomyces sp. YM15 TaxID=2800446 RepID=UPI00196453A7|nr:hypothetical protein [Glycomyces sp. YM15]